LLNFGGSDIGIVLSYFFLGLFYEIAVALVVFRQSMAIAVGAVTRFAAEAKESYLFVAGEAARMIGLAWSWLFGDLGNFEILHFLFDAFLLLVLSEWRARYL
jgi:hypothetical protein